MFVKEFLFLLNWGIISFHSIYVRFRLVATQGTNNIQHVLKKIHTPGAEYAVSTCGTAVAFRDIVLNSRSAANALTTQSPREEFSTKSVNEKKKRWGTSNYSAILYVVVA